jgi:hypothetical protein
MNNLSGFNSQEIRRLHPYLSALLRQLKEIETRVDAVEKVAWGKDEHIQPTANANIGGVLNRFARADHQHLFKFPTAVPLSTPDGTAFFDISTSAINIYVDDTPTTRVVAGGTYGDVQPTGRWRTGEVPRYAYADHSHPTALLSQSDPQTPVVGEIRYNADNKIVRWDGSAWVELSVERLEAGTNDDVQPTKLRSAGSSLRYARADHSHPTAILPQADAQTPVVDEIRYDTDNKVVRWDGTAWVPLSVETFTIDWGTNDDVQPTKTRSAGTSTRVARADHSHPTAILPQGDSQTPVADEIRYNTNNKIVRWNGTTWVEMSVETVEAGTDDDVQPTRLRSAGSSARFARADHSHPTALLPQSDTQTPVVNEIRFSTDDKVVRWDGTAWVPLSVETFTVEWATNDDVQATRLRSTGTATRFARADHSHPTAILPQSDSQTPVADEIRYNTNNKLVRWDGSDWVPLSVETFTIDWGTDDDVQPTRQKSAGSSTRVARADHSHPTALLPQSDTQTPVVDEIRYNTNNKIVRWDGSNWVPLSVETGGGEAGTDDDVQPTKLKSAGSSTRYARADHSHPTAILPQSDTQTPVADEIRYNSNNKLVRWDGSSWVALSEETIDWATNADVQATGLKSTGTATRVARADHSHPTALLPVDNPQTPVENEIRYNDAQKIVRWNGYDWIELSVENIPAGLPSDVQPTGLKSEGTVFRFARANHSHPTAILHQGNSQIPVINEIRYTGTNRLVRWTGSGWVDIMSPLPVPANPLVLPLSSEVSSPLNRQLFNHSSWDNIGEATVFYYDANNIQSRLIFARPLVVATSSTPSGKNVWDSKANELVLKYHSGNSSGAAGVLWSRGGNSTVWSPVLTQLIDSSTDVLTSDVGVLARSALTGTSGSRRWFIRGAQENGSFRAPFAGIATFTSSTTPAPTDLSTGLNDGYAYFIYDIDRVDIVKPTTDGNKHPVMLPHYIIAPPCRIFSTAIDPSGHYVRDLEWNSAWVIAFHTTTSATTNLIAVLPTITIPYGLQAGRVLMYLHNPQSSAITTVFALLVRTFTSTGVQDALTSDATVNIPANTTVVVDLGHLAFPPSTSLSHHRCYPASFIIVRKRTSETSNSNTVYCLAVAIVPQRSA